jgi:hypothetical protein
MKLDGNWERGVANLRLQRQRLIGPGFADPDQVVAWFGAMQAQEFEHAKWAIGLRLKSAAVQSTVARAIDEGRILRTHVLRPTWHFVTPADIRWMLELTAPCVRRRMATYWRQLRLNAATLARGTRLIERALRDGQHLTRRELGDVLKREGLALHHIPLAHLAMYAELEGVICSGPRRGAQSTYALLAERAPGARSLAREEALATLAQRFFQSHGPATIRDFVWWSGLSTPDAKRALEMIDAGAEQIDGLTYWTAGSAPRRATRDTLVHLLPIYDEYLVAYRDREAVPHLLPAKLPGKRPFVTFQHALVIDGQVAGTWRTTRLSKAIDIDVGVTPVRRLSSFEQDALATSLHRYKRFVSR